MRVEQFQIDQEETNDTFILHISGELDLSVVPQLRSVLEPVVHQSEKGLILNLKNLKYIDSTGIGIIVSVLKIRDGLNASFYVQEVPSSIRRLFDLTGLSSYLVEGIEDKG